MSAPTVDPEILSEIIGEYMFRAGAGECHATHLVGYVPFGDEPDTFECDWLRVETSGAVMVWNPGCYTRGKGHNSPGVWNPGSWESTGENVRGGGLQVAADAFVRFRDGEPDTVRIWTADEARAAFGMR